MSHDQSKELTIKDETKSSKRHASGCHPKLGGAQSKLGLTPINKRNFKIWRLVLHVAAEQCYCVWTDCGRVSIEQEWYRVEREEGDFEQCFSCDLLTKNYYATTRTTPTTSHKPPCSTRPPVKFNNTGQWTSHEPMLRQLHRPSRCTNSISTTTDNNIPCCCRLL